MPAQAGIHGPGISSCAAGKTCPWTPAFAGVVGKWGGSGRTPHVQAMIIPDYVMTTDDYTGLGRIMMDHVMTRHDHAGRSAHANRHIAAKGRIFPAWNARHFICIEIIGRRGIGQADEPYIAETIDRHQGIPPRPRVPAGNTHQVPYQPWPEERPDMVEVALKVRMHTLKDGGAGYQTNSDDPRGVIPENAKRFSGTQKHCSHNTAGSRISPAGFPG